MSRRPKWPTVRKWWSPLARSLSLRNRNTILQSVVNFGLSAWARWGASHEERTWASRYCYVERLPLIVASGNWAIWEEKQEIWPDRAFFLNILHAEKPKWAPENTLVG